MSDILRFAACETNSCVNITIVDDTEIESDEAFNITLEMTPGLNGAIILDAVDGMIRISDDDDDGRLNCSLLPIKWAWEQGRYNYMPSNPASISQLV